MVVKSWQGSEGTSTSPFSFSTSSKPHAPMTMIGDGPADFGSFGSTQWAAVTIHCGCTKTAPQTWILALLRNDTMYGCRPQVAFLPFYTKHNSEFIQEMMSYFWKTTSWKLLYQHFDTSEANISGRSSPHLILASSIWSFKEGHKSIFHPREFLKLAFAMDLQRKCQILQCFPCIAMRLQFR